jgi:predicted small secreted protein
VFRTSLLLSIFIVRLACNTSAGFGKNLKQLGSRIENRAKESPSTDK